MHTQGVCGHTQAPRSLLSCQCSNEGHSGIHTSECDFSIFHLRVILTKPYFQIAFHMPQEYKELEVHCDFLPLHDQPPGRPFTSMVVNLGAVTKGHRDGGDKTWCGTFTIGDCKGGQICCYEAGLVLESRPSDFITFESQEQTHFNLNVEGIRASIVLHSDRTMDSWSGDGEEEQHPYNQWGSHVH